MSNRSPIWNNGKNRSSPRESVTSSTSGTTIAPQSQLVPSFTAGGLESLEGKRSVLSFLYLKGHRAAEQCECIECVKMRIKKIPKKGSRKKSRNRDPWSRPRQTRSRQLHLQPTVNGTIPDSTLVNDQTENEEARNPNSSSSFDCNTPIYACQCSACQRSYPQHSCDVNLDFELEGKELRDVSGIDGIRAVVSPQGFVITVGLPDDWDWDWWAAELSADPPSPKLESSTMDLLDEYSEPAEWEPFWKEYLDTQRSKGDLAHPDAVWNMSTLATMNWPDVMLGYDTLDSTIDDRIDLGLSYGWPSPHLVFESSQVVPLSVCNMLGVGSLGVVEEVRNTCLKYPPFVRKRVPLPFHDRLKRKKTIQEEARILKQLTHPHIVTILGSYEEKTLANRHFYCLLMTPVGEHDLKTFLEMAGEDTTSQSLYRNWIQKWFSCLASALAYMHEEGIRHQDIKPSNIIQKGSDIYFTDFSSSSRFEIGKTTSTDNPARSSATYAAPEIAARFQDGNIQRHGRHSDVFSLGAVFCEMLTVRLGGTVPAFHEFLLRSPQSPESGGFEGVLLYSRKTELIQDWFESSEFFSKCLAPMLALQRHDRPSASKVVINIRKHSTWSVDCSCAPQLPVGFWNLPGVNFNVECPS